MKTKTLYDFSARDITGKEQALSRYRNQVVLIVNVASQCGFTPQYQGLEALHRNYSEQGFSVLGFPCNQFGAQEPGDEAEILHFCRSRYDVSFPIFAKIDVNGPHAHPLYRWLKQARPGLLGSRAIKWYFSKFLLDRNGLVVRRYAPTTKPASLNSAILACLQQQN